MKYVFTPIKQEKKDKKEKKYVALKKEVDVDLPSYTQLFDNAKNKINIDNIDVLHLCTFKTPTF